MLANPDEAARMGKAGRTLAETRLSLDHWVSAVAELTVAA